MRAIRGEWSGDDRRMRGESQAVQNSIRKNAEIVTERGIDEGPEGRAGSSAAEQVSRGGAHPVTEL